MKSRTKSTNIFLDDFPERMETDELLKKLASNYNITEAKSEPTAKRRTALQTLQKRWFYSDLRLRDIYNGIYNVLYQSYDNRDESDFVKINSAIRKWHDTGEAYCPASNDYSVKNLSIIGIPGIGKTHAVKRILRNCFRQLIDRGNTTQITYLITNCDDIGSLKQMVSRFVSEVDRLLGSGYGKKVLPKHGKENVEAVAASLCSLHYIGVWVIDEIHHLSKVPFNSAQQIVNFLKNLSAVVGIPIIYIGTSEAFSVLAENFQVARRADGNGSIFMEVYENDHRWSALVRSLWRRTVLRNEKEITKEIIDAYYNASAGIIDRLIAVHIKSQEIALDEECEEITTDIISRSEKYFQFTKRGIKAMLSHRKEDLLEFPDLSMRGVNAVNEISKIGALTEKDIVNLVMDGGFNKEEVNQIFRAMLDSKDVSKSNKAKNGKDKKSKKPQTTTNKKPKPVRIKGSAYDFAKSNGMIPDRKTLAKYIKK